MISAAVLILEHPRQPGALSSLLQRVLAAEIAEVICVTNNLLSVRREIQFTDSRLFWYLNPAPSRGQSSSVIGALWASDPRSAGIMVIEADQSRIFKELINSIIEKFRKTEASIVAASYAGVPRSPILFRGDFFPELLNLTGDDIGRSLLDKYPKKTALVDWPEDVSILNSEHGQEYLSVKERV
jgi:CTP:molybdopterin cytidylyltransferase MocA